jgi:hypothetical protein
LHYAWLTDWGYSLRAKPRSRSVGARRSKYTKYRRTSSVGPRGCDVGETCYGSLPRMIYECVKRELEAAQVDSDILISNDFGTVPSSTRYTGTTLGYSPTIQHKTYHSLGSRTVPDLPHQRIYSKVQSITWLNMLFSVLAITQNSASGHHRQHSS